MFRIDMHIHTISSKDSLNGYEKILKVCKSRSLNGLVICDHDAIDGALKLKSMQREVNIIVGEEINTKQGEIIGLFLKEYIKPNQEIEYTVSQIRGQGGLIYVPHPFDRLRKKRIHDDALEKIRDSIDIIEVFNSRNVYKLDDEKAREFARVNSLAMGVGSDAHTPWEIGKSFIEIGDFKTPAEFMDNLKNANRYTHRSLPHVHVMTKLVKMRNKILNR